MGKELSEMMRFPFSAKSGLNGLRPHAADPVYLHSMILKVFPHASLVSFDGLSSDCSIHLLKLFKSERIYPSIHFVDLLKLE